MTGSNGSNVAAYAVVSHRSSAHPKRRSLRVFLSAGSALALVMLTACTGAPMIETARRTSPPIRSIAVTPAASPAPTSSPAAIFALPTETPIPPQQRFTFDSPQAGANLSNPFRLSGSVALTPPDKTLRYRITDAAGRVIGDGTIAVEGDIAETGVFSAMVSYTMSLAGPAQLELAAPDGSARLDVQIPALTVNLPIGVGLTLNGVANKARAEIVPRKLNARSWIDWDGWPQHVRVLFDDDPFEKTFDPRTRQLLILPLAPYRALFRGAEGALFEEAIQTLSATLAVRPAQLERDPALLPASDLSQAVRTPPHYLNFDGGSGMRFITHLTQEIGLLTATSFVYTFQGLTHDGRYYIAAYFPVTTTALPATTEAISSEQRDEFKRNYLAYAARIAQLLADEPERFTPALAALDAMIESLRIADDLLDVEVLQLDGVIGTATELLNVRAGPGTRFRILGQLDAGEAAELIGRDPSGRWIQIRTADGTLGWVSRDYISSAASLSALPLAP